MMIVTLVIERNNNIRKHSDKWALAHLAWLAMFFAILLWGFGDKAATDLANKGNIYRISLMAFATIAGVISLAKYPKKLFSVLPFTLMFMYGVFALITSLLVPVDAFYSMYKALEIIVDVIIISALAGRSNPLISTARAYNLVIILFVLLLMAFLLEAIIMPDRALLPSRGLLPVILEGVYPTYSANGVGFISAVCLYVSIVRLLRRKGLSAKLMYVIFSFTGAAGLILSQARTSLVAMFVAVMVYLIINKKLLLMIIIIPLMLGVVIYTGGGETIQAYVVRGQDVELLTSLTGRTHGWKAAWEFFKESPVYGHGFAAAARRNILGVSGASTMHGAVFDVIVGVGMLGLITWGGAIIISSYKLIAVRKKALEVLRGENAGLPSYDELFGVAVIIFIRSITNSGLSMHDHVFMLALAIIAVVYSLSAYPQK